MAIPFEMHRQPHGTMVSCYRPIVTSVRVSGATMPAHFEVHLYVRDYYGGPWSNTGVSANAYYDGEAQQGALKIYSCNMAEYCRQFFTEEECFYEQNWCQNWINMSQRNFKLFFYPTKFLSSGLLETDYDDVVESNEFIVVPTITDSKEATDMALTPMRLDRFVCNGQNESGLAWGNSAWNKLLSNMPQNQTIDMSNGFYYYYQYLHQGASTRRAFFTITNNTTGVSMDFEAPSWNFTGFVAQQINPTWLEYQLAISSGSVQNLLIDASGNLLTNSMTVQTKFKTYPGYSPYRETPAMTYNLIDSDSIGGSCTSKVFLFRNMRGGFDWFTAKGTQKKETSLTSTEYERVTDYNRHSNGGDFDTITGQHSTQRLWNKKVDSFSVFSQAVSPETADWLTELIVSPQVWIIEQQVGGFGNGPGMIPPLESYGTRLTPINIDAGSYKVHNTERRANYIEFKYKLSNNNLVQKN